MNHWEDIFGQAPSSFEDRVRETLNGLEENTVKTNNAGKKARPAWRTALIAGIAAVLLAGSALAVTAAHTEFFHTAYGTGIESRETYTVEKTDIDGNVVGYEEYPAIERAETDPETAEALIGRHVATAADASAELCGYTFTVRDYVIDKNGIGAITVDVDNPDGLNIRESGRYDAYAGEFMPFTMSVRAGGWPLDTRELLDTETASDTHARYAVYIAGGAASGDLTLHFAAWNGTFMEQDGREEANGQVFPNYDEAELIIPAADPAAARSFAGDGLTAELSPVGVTLRWKEGEASDEPTQLNLRTIIIEYGDGSEYTVIGEGVYNETVALGMYTTEWHAFNRLVDPDSVTAIRVEGYTAPVTVGGSGVIPVPEPLEQTLVPAD